MLLRLRLGKMDVGVFHLDELVTHCGVAVVLVAREPRTIVLTAMVTLGGSFPAAVPRVDTDDFLVLLEGDVTGNPRQGLMRKTELNLHTAGSY